MKPDRKTEDIKSETIKTEERKEAISAKTAEQEACCMEHVISENSFRHLKQSMDKKK